MDIILSLRHRHVIHVSLTLSIYTIFWVPVEGRKALVVSHKIEDLHGDYELIEISSHTELSGPHVKLGLRQVQLL